ncbi:MAG TPA: phosphate acyltransferase [Longimicrobiales bacterium]|nr:phosphate acyltransferase [Longimicrobiales bacterium]
MSDFLAGLRERAGRLRRRIALPETGDTRVLEAAVALATGGLARPVLVGPEAVVRERLAALGDPAGVDVLDGPDGADGIGHAAGLVQDGVVDGCVAGAVQSTPAVLRAYLREIGPAEGLRTVSSAFYMRLADPGMPEGERVLTFTDAGVVPDPDEGELVAIARAAADARRAIVGDAPRVAFLSYSTLGSADGPSARRVREAARRFAVEAPDIASDGELQADAALVPEIARRKAPHSPVAGSANVLVFPDLDAANIAYKLVQRLAGATALGPILQGLAAPANDLSRGATAEDIVHVACITSLLR